MKETDRPTRLGREREAGRRMAPSRGRRILARNSQTMPGDRMRINRAASLVGSNGPLRMACHVKGRTVRTARTSVSKASKRKAATNEVEKVELELAVKPDAPAPEPEHVKLDPIKDFDVGLFDQMLDTSAADDIFDFDKLAEMVNTGSGRKEISFDEAIELGVLPNLDGEGKK